MKLKTTRFLCFLLILALTASLFTGCKQEVQTETPTTVSSKEQSVPSSSETSSVVSAPSTVSQTTSSEEQSSVPSAPESSKEESTPEESQATVPPSNPVEYPQDEITQKTCYLTFDDGPSHNTLKVLDILEQYGVKATFFVMGTGNLSYVKKIHEAGHTVALHTYSHEYSQIYASQKAYFDDLQKISDAVKAQIGIESKVIRFPGGSSNTVSTNYCTGIMSALAVETANQGYVYFDWNIDSTDASGNNVPASTIVANVKKYGGRSKQDIVLMHDTGAKGTTVEALPQIIEYYIEKGYTFAPITVNTPPVHHGINN